MTLGKAIRRIGKFFVLAILYPGVYRICSLRPVAEKKAVFVEVRLPAISDSLALLHAEMENRGYMLCDHFLRTGFHGKERFLVRCLKYIIDISNAKYIFISDATNVLGWVKLRSETKMIQTWHGCGAFKKFGYSTCEHIFGPARKELEFYPTSNHYSLVTVSSPEVVWAYQEAMGIDAAKIVPIGISRTDVFFDEKFISKAKERFYQKIPQARGKKVMLYAPTFRGRVSDAKAPDRLSMKLFYENFSKEYVLVIKNHPLVRENPKIPERYREFAMDASEGIDIEALLIMADLCITDYSSLIFEYSLFERPMFFFAYDMEEYCDWRGFYYEYDALTPGPVCRTNEELVSRINNLEKEFSRKTVADFKNKFMSACDGKATERILNYMQGGKDHEGNFISSRGRKQTEQKGRQA